MFLNKIFKIQPNKNIIRSLVSNTYKVEKINIVDKQEDIIVGGKEKFYLLNKGFEGIKQIGIIGWGSQGPSQALNLQDSLRKCGSKINIKIGLRENSKSIKSVLDTGIFKENNIGSIEEVLRESDMNIILTSDSSQTELYETIFNTIKPQSTLAFSHGFLLGYLKNNNNDFPENNNIIMMAPKGMGPTLRDKYLQDDGINSSISVYRNITGKATDYAISWGIAVGSPYIFETSMRKEYISDIFGERAILLGGIYGMVEYLFQKYSSIYCLDSAFKYSVGTITGPINDSISKYGLYNIYDNMSLHDKGFFEISYIKSYEICREIFEEIYREVESGNEINSVKINDNKINNNKMSNISNSHMWKIGEKIYNGKNENNIINITDRIFPETAGIYIGGIMAQVDILSEKGHSYSEIVNESIIEATDSLNPYMNEKGISHMVDNCSITARLGARKWAPRLEYAFRNNYENYEGLNLSNKNELIEEFQNHKIHKIVKELYKYKV